MPENKLRNGESNMAQDSKPTSVSRLSDSPEGPEYLMAYKGGFKGGLIGGIIGAIITMIVCLICHYMLG
jgi:hypothetical protein